MTQHDAELRSTEVLEQKVPANVVMKGKSGRSIPFRMARSRQHAIKSVLRATEKSQREMLTTQIRTQLDLSVQGTTVQ